MATSLLCGPTSSVSGRSPSGTKPSSPPKMRTSAQRLVIEVCRHSHPPTSHDRGEEGQTASTRASRGDGATRSPAPIAFPLILHWSRRARWRPVQPFARTSAKACVHHAGERRRHLPVAARSSYFELRASITSLIRSRPSTMAACGTLSPRRPTGWCVSSLGYTDRAEAEAGTGELDLLWTFDHAGSAKQPRDDASPTRNCRRSSTTRSRMG